MEYSISAFVDTLRSMMYDRFPYMSNERLNEQKHPNRTGHIRDVAFMDLPLQVGVDGQTITFDIGSDNAERYYPYYHILEDAPVIRKRYRATEKSKGSQQYVDDLSKRDYGKVYWSGKSFTKEYAKNVRGSRNKVVQNATRHLYVGGKMQPVMVNKNANSYKNEHYHYIERMLTDIVPLIAAEYGLRTMRPQDTGLGEEYSLQEESNYTMITNILDSFR